MGQVTTSLTALCKKERFEDWTGKDDDVSSTFSVMPNHSASSIYRPFGSSCSAVESGADSSTATPSFFDLSFDSMLEARHTCLWLWAACRRFHSGLAHSER